MRMAKNEFRNDKGIKTSSQDTSYGVQFVFQLSKLLFSHSISAISETHQAIDEPKLFVFKISLAALFVIISQTLNNFFQKKIR